MSQKRKLAVVIAHFGIGGGQKVVLDLLKAMDRSCYDVKLFVHNSRPENQFTKELDAMGMAVEYVERGKGVSLGNYRGLAKALNRFGPDVVHIHLDTLYAPLWALLHRKRTLFTLHSQPYRAFDSGMLRALHRFLARQNFYQITAVSDTIAGETEKLLSLPAGSVKAIYNPVAVPEPYERVPADKTRFVHVARFNPVKNHKLLLTAFAKVCAQCPDTVLNLAGDGELFDACVDYARQLQIENYVNFLGNVTDVPGLLRQQDVFVLSSDSEAMPISVLEAMAYGLPVVATEVGGVPDVVKENGLLVPRKDADALAEAMLRLARDPDGRQKMGRDSYVRARQFHVTQILAAYEALYIK